MDDFIKTLNEKFPFKFGEQGYKKILTLIYREGNISLRLLSFSLNISVKDLVAVINYLTEKNILARIEDGILLTDNGMQYIEKELALYGFGIEECEHCEGHPFPISPRWDKFLEEIDTRIEEIFPQKTEIIQKESIGLRTIYLYDEGFIEGKSVALLGKAIIYSLGITNIYLGVYPEEPILIPDKLYLIHSDDKIGNKINENLNNLNHDIICKNYHLKEPVTKEFNKKMDIVILYSSSNIEIFSRLISRAVGMLKKQSQKQILCFLDNPSLEERFSIQKTLTEMNLLVKDYIWNLTEYFNMDPAVNINNMPLLIIETTENSKPVIMENETIQEKSFVSAMDEINKIDDSIQILWCENCEKSIIISKENYGNFSVRTREQLNSQGCPFCKEKGKFNEDEIEEEIIDNEKFLKSFE